MSLAQGCSKPETGLQPTICHPCQAQSARAKVGDFCLPQATTQTALDLTLSFAQTSLHEAIQTSDSQGAEGSYVMVLDLTMQAPKPRPGNISTLFACVGTTVFPWYSTGSKGDPAAKMHLRSMHLRIYPRPLAKPKLKSRRNPALNHGIDVAGLISL